MAEDMLEQETIDRVETNEHVRPELKDKIVRALAQVEDPELGIDIVNLGLVYNVHMDEDQNIEVIMTLTSMGCPLAGTIVSLVREALSDIEGASDVEVNIVWQPVWSKENMSRLARVALGV